METSVEKPELTLSIVAPCLKLSKLQTRAIFTGILQRTPPEPQTPLDEESLFFLFVADMLERVDGLTSEQRQLLLTEMRAAGLATAPGLRQLILIDGKYSTWTQQQGFLILETAEIVNTLPDPPIETIGYNLNELCRRGILLAENKIHVEKRTAGSVAQP